MRCIEPRRQRRHKAKALSLAAKAEGTQGKGAVVSREGSGGTMQMRCLRREGRGDTR